MSADARLLLAGERRRLGGDDARRGRGRFRSQWDNDGFVKRLDGSFTELVERLMARGFAHTWAYSDTHPDTDEVLRRLAVEVPLRSPSR